MYKLVRSRPSLLQTLITVTVLTYKQTQRRRRRRFYTNLQIARTGLLHTFGCDPCAADSEVRRTRLHAFMQKNVPAMLCPTGLVAILVVVHILLAAPTFGAVPCTIRVEAQASGKCEGDHDVCATLESVSGVALRRARQPPAAPLCSYFCSCYVRLRSFHCNVDFFS